MSTHTHNHSGGFILSSDSIKLPHEAGSFVIGAASYMTGKKSDNDSTTGLFGAYTYKRLTLNAQVAENKYTGATDYGTSIYFVPQLQLTDSIFVKTRITFWSSCFNFSSIFLSFGPNPLAISTKNKTKSFFRRFKRRQKI